MWHRGVAGGPAPSYLPACPSLSGAHPIHPPACPSLRSSPPLFARLPTSQERRPPYEGCWLLKELFHMQQTKFQALNEGGEEFAGDDSG